RPLKDLTQEDVARCLCDGIRSEGLARLDWTPEAVQLRSRLAFARRLGGHPVGADLCVRPSAHTGEGEGAHTGPPLRSWPDVGDEALEMTLEAWLLPALMGKRTLEEASRADVAECLALWVGHRAMQELNRLAPTHIEVPSGSRIRLDYAAGDAPVLAVRIQEVFGMMASPRVGGGTVPVVVHLLSPARRPVQVTQDLASFWRTGYALTRKDLRGRYPKHYWPEDPSQAEPRRGLRT
ncbi:MAG: ATP-dependent helicase HrpB, partial [Kiritimatiellaeota bacterium]|nr:ATP-dependent helicase HrpB [Kiritimatiellota bacterium]